MYFVFNHFGIQLSTGSNYYWNYYTNFGTEVSEGNALPGDIVSWSGHVGIYVGDGQMINALNEKYGVMYAAVNSYYYTDENGQKIFPPYRFIRVNGVNYGPKSGELDVNGLLDGINMGATGIEGDAIYGTFDVYINGGLVADDQWDFINSYLNEPTYEITDIKARDGFSYDGSVSDNLSGTISAGSKIDVRLKFNSCKLDVSGNLDNQNNDTLGSYGTFDVYINGVLKANDVNDFNQRITKGATYEIRDIKIQQSWRIILRLD